MQDNENCVSTPQNHRKYFKVKSFIEKLNNTEDYISEADVKNYSSAQTQSIEPQKLNDLCHSNIQRHRAKSNGHERATIALEGVNLQILVAEKQKMEENQVASNTQNPTSQSSAQTIIQKQHEAIKLQRQLIEKQQDMIKSLLSERKNFADLRNTISASLPVLAQNLTVCQDFRAKFSQLQTQLRDRLRQVQYAKVISGMHSQINEVSDTVTRKLDQFAKQLKVVQHFENQLLVPLSPKMSGSINTFTSFPAVTQVGTHLDPKIAQAIDLFMKHYSSKQRGMTPVQFPEKKLLEQQYQELAKLVKNRPCREQLALVYRAAEAYHKNLLNLFILIMTQFCTIDILSADKFKFNLGASELTQHIIVANIIKQLSVKELQNYINKSEESRNQFLESFSNLQIFLWTTPFSPVKYILQFANEFSQEWLTMVNKLTLTEVRTQELFTDLVDDHQTFSFLVLLLVALQMYGYEFSFSQLKMFEQNQAFKVTDDNVFYFYNGKMLIAPPVRFTLLPLTTSVEQELKVLQTYAVK